MTQQQIVVRLFDYFYVRVYQNSGFYLNINIRNHQAKIDNFFKRLSKEHHLQSLGVEFFIDYFCFSWAYWDDKKLQRNVALEWIIGIKALERWYARSEHYQYFYKTGFLKKYKISLEALRDNVSESVDVYEEELSDAEELERSRFTGAAKLINCTEHTTLYHMRSKHCRACPVKKECKALLKKTNRKLYIKRGYK